MITKIYEVFVRETDAEIGHIGISPWFMNHGEVVANTAISTTPVK